MSDCSQGDKDVFSAAHSEQWQQLQVMQRHFLQLNQAFFQSLQDRPVTNHQCMRSNIDRWADQPEVLEQGIAIDALIQHVQNDVFPGLAASRGGRYWGFVTGGASPVATFADWLVSTMDQNVSHNDGSIAGDIERLTLTALCDLFELPQCFNGIFTTGATASNFLAALCIRQKAGEYLGVNIARDGMCHLDLDVFSTTPHASMLKTLGMAGIGHHSIVNVAAVTGTERMDVSALVTALSASDAKSKCVIASAGTVTGTDFDDFQAIAELCREHDAWLHVDAAFGMFERLISGSSGKTKGIELADSITLDCHKWLNVPYDCGVFLTRQSQHLFDSCHVPAPYLMDSVDEPDFMSLGIENSRRFRAFPVYLSILAYGKAGIRAGVKSNMDLAHSLASWLAQNERFELLYPCQLNVVVFRPLPKALPKKSTVSCNDVHDGLEATSLDAFCQAFLQTLNQEGRVFMTSGRWQGKACIRAALSNWSTTTEDMAIAQQALMSALDKTFK